MELDEIVTKFHSQYIMSSEHTKSKYKHDLALFLQICDIKTTNDLQNFDYSASLEKFYYYAKAHEWSPNTINQRLQVAKLFTAWANDEEIIPKDFLKKVKRVRTENTIHYIPSVTDCQTLLEYIKKHTKNRRMYIMVKLVLSSGLRKSEICNLKWTDLDFINSKIRVVGKGKKIVEQPIHKDLMQEIHTYIYTDRKELVEKYTQLGGKDKGYLFMSCLGENPKQINLEDGNKLSSTSFFISLKRYAKSAGIPNWDKITPHSLRRFAGTQIYEQTGDIRTAQEFLRHSNVNTTVECYVGYNKKRLEDAVSKLYYGIGIEPQIQDPFCPC